MSSGLVCIYSSIHSCVLQVIAEVLKKQQAESGQEAGDTTAIPMLFDKVYENLIEEVDAIDNGIHQTDGKPR